MSKIHCYTSISLSYLDRANVLASTLKKLHPDWELWLCISDSQPEGFKIDNSARLFDHLVWVNDLPVENLNSWIFKHNVVELCTAVKGLMLNKILRSGAKTVVYLDPDIAVLNSLNPVVEQMQGHSIGLTPHLLHPETEVTAIYDNEISTLLHGVYNLGFLVVNNSDEGTRFADWWEHRLLMASYEKASEGIYTDQRWCDLIPAFFEGVKILRDPGLNVASWNISKRRIHFDELGQLYAGESLLRFYHFTKISTVGLAATIRYMGDSYAILHLLKWYTTRLAEASTLGLPVDWWFFGHYSDGSPIQYGHRELYRSDKELQTRFPDPFCADTFLAYIKSNDIP